jgi:hypothetical protein
MNTLMMEGAFDEEGAEEKLACVEQFRITCATLQRVEMGACMGGAVWAAVSSAAADGSCSAIHEKSDGREQRNMDGSCLRHKRNNLRERQLKAGSWGEVLTKAQRHKVNCGLRQN